MDLAHSTREACELLRTATVLRRAWRWEEGSDAIERATALIRSATEETDRRREIIAAWLRERVERPTVLIVDDEGAILQFLRLILERAGFDVLTTRFGPDAVAAYASRARIDLVLLDVQMPKPWDGPATLAELQRRAPGVRAAFMSGSTGEYTERNLLARGAIRVFAKPFASLDALTASLHALAGG